MASCGLISFWLPQVTHPPSPQKKRKAQIPYSTFRFYCSAVVSNLHGNSRVFVTSLEQQQRFVLRGGELREWLWWWMTTTTVTLATRIPSQHLRYYANSCCDGLLHGKMYILEAVLVAVINDATSNTTITTHNDDFYDWYRGEGGWYCYRSCCCCGGTIGCDGDGGGS